MSDSNNSMNLVRWNLPTDVFNYGELANNLLKIAEHNHSTGKGVQIGADGIQNNSINHDKLVTDSITDANRPVWTDNIKDGSITTEKLHPTVTNQLLPSYVTTLPTSPIDGQEIYFEADDTTSAIWHLRYRGAQNRWEYMGGNSVADLTYAADDTTVSTAGGTTYAGTTTASVTTPSFTGSCSYLIDIFAQFGSSAATNEVFVSFKKGSTNANDDDSFSQYVTVAGAAGVMSGHRSVVVSGITAPTTFKVQVRSADAATITLYRHTISVRPIFVI